MNAQDALHTLDYQHRRGLTPNEAAEEAISIYLALGAEIKAIEQAQAAAKQVISDLMVELGEDRFETHAGTALVTQPSFSVSYDAKKVDNFLLGRPDLAPLFTPFRAVKEKAGYLMIRAGNSK